jgi:hypothetical protein
MREPQMRLHWHYVQRTYLYYKILDKAGIYLKANSRRGQRRSRNRRHSFEHWNFGKEEEKSQSGRIYIKHSLEELNELLGQAVSGKIMRKLQKREKYQKESILFLLFYLN